jgi:hypothetical protein
MSKPLAEERTILDVEYDIENPRVAAERYGRHRHGLGGDALRWFVEGAVYGQETATRNCERYAEAKAAIAERQERHAQHKRALDELAAIKVDSRGLVAGLPPCPGCSRNELFAWRRSPKKYGFKCYNCQFSRTFVQVGRRVRVGGRIANDLEAAISAGELVVDAAEVTP